MAFIIIKHYVLQIIFLLMFNITWKIINRDHGYPLRVVVPGVIGARSVKWLDSIDIIKEECQVLKFLGILLPFFLGNCETEVNFLFL